MDYPSPKNFKTTIQATQSDFKVTEDESFDSEEGKYDHIDNLVAFFGIYKFR